MQEISVDVVGIQGVRPHTNADSLELATVGGWQTCVPKGEYKNGDAVVYFEQETVFPLPTAKALGVGKRIKKK